MFLNVALENIGGYSCTLSFPFGHWDMPRGLDSLAEADRLTVVPSFYQWTVSFHMVIAPS